MKTTSQIANFPRLRRSPGLAEIATILERLPESAFLVETQNNRIIASNTKFSELTQYSQEELKNLSLTDLATDFDKDTTWGTQSDDSEPKKLSLTIQNNTVVQVLANRVELSPHEKWDLILLEPVSLIEQRQSDHQRRSELLESMNTFSQALYETELKPALELFLDAAQKITGASTLSIYLQNLSTDYQDFEVLRFCHHGPAENLPSELPALELANLRTVQFWTASQRVPTSLQRTARSAGLKYVASSPLGQANAMIGLIAIGGNQSPPADELLARLQILAEAVTALVEGHTRRSNLGRELDDLTSKNHIHQAIENVIFDGVIVLNPNLTISRLNHASESILGYSNQEAQGHPVEDILIGTETLMPVLQAAQKGDQTIKQSNIRLYHRSGQAFLAQVSTAPTIVDEKLYGIIIMIQDLTEQEQIQLQTQELERRALLGEVTAIFAHEVRNPINNISTGLQLMAYNLPDGDPNQDVIGRLQNDCERLSELMKSVLAFSRPAEYEMVDLDLGSLIQRLVDRSRPRMSNANVEPHLQFDNQTPSIRGNQRALEQVFTNLINNAIQAMRESGGTLAIKMHKLQSPGQSPYIQVDVADSGPGIPKENLERIFQPFFTTKSDGTGLGLAITKRIVTAHKGNIEVTSFPGGTVFHVKLPISEAL